jgi:hypothetical protein
MLLECEAAGDIGGRGFSPAARTQLYRDIKTNKLFTHLFWAEMLSLMQAARRRMERVLPSLSRAGRSLRSS